jgi:urea transporter
MRKFWKGLLVAAVFAGVWALTTRVISVETAVLGPYRPEVRLAAMMGGLFAGGFAASLTLIALVWKRKKS